jgi:hypothetical protein
MAYTIFKKIIAETYPDENKQPSIEQQLNIWDKVVAENIFVICKTPMAKSITKRTLVGFRDTKVNTRYFEDLVNQIINKQQNFLEKVKQGKTYWKSNNNDNMKFNAIVGNPPYQEMDGGAQASAGPIYNHFVETAIKMNPCNISMIMPSRWYSGGKGLDDFRNNMLNDKHIAVLHDYLNPEQVFPNTNIRGGICYFLWNNEYDNAKSLTKVVTHQSKVESITAIRSLRSDNANTFIRHSAAIAIVDKINAVKTFKSFADHVSSLRPFGFRGYFINSEHFHTTNRGLANYVRCYGKGKKVGYVDRELVKQNLAWIDNFKVYTPRANNIGTELNDDNLNTFIGEEGTICTESYIVLGADLKLNKNSAANLCKYFTTKFVRMLHSLAKASQDATSKTYKFVPLQDFTKYSDIDWSRSIPEIDQQLFAKYKLTNEEIKFIDSMIKSML